MRKFIKWTAVLTVMFCVSTLLSMWAGNDVSWAAFVGGQWGVGAIFAPLLTAVCWALWPTPTYSPFDGIGCSCCCCNCIGCNNLFCKSIFRDDDYYHYYSDDNFMKDE